MDRQVEGKRLTFSQKWGDDPFTQSGHTQVPNALITYAHRLGLRSEECWLITCILRFKYDDSNPTPSQELLAELFGQSVDTVQRTVKKIVDKKLLKVERIRDEVTRRYTHTVYDFTPLRFALNDCYYQDHPEERPQTPHMVVRSKATPQKCGLASESTYTAEMRPGSQRELHRRSAAWPTPQICGVYKGNKKNINVQEERPLNVREDGGEAKATERPTLNTSGTGMFALREKAVEEVINLTSDEGSRRRFEQLWDIAEGREALDAWKAAHRAVKRRMEATGKEPLERPGAYFDATCVRELEKRQVFVPTSEEKQGQKDIAEVIRQGLFQDADIPEKTPVAIATELPAAQRPLESAETPAQFDAELLQLKREGGELWESFQTFVAAEKARYVAEMGSVSSTARERLLTTFDRLEKRRSLLRAWKISRGDKGGS